MTKRRAGLHADDPCCSVRCTAAQATCKAPDWSRKGSAGSAGGTRSGAPAWGGFLDVPRDPVVVVCLVTSTSIMQEEERRQRRREKERNSQKAGEAWERQRAQLNRERTPTPMPRPVATQRQDGSITLNLRRDQQGDGGWVSSRSIG